MQRVQLIAPAMLGQHSLSAGVSLNVSDEQADAWRAAGLIAAQAPEAQKAKAPSKAKATKPADTTPTTEG